MEKQMEKQFAVYAIAKKLKQIGFNEACLGLFNIVNGVTPKFRLGNCTMENMYKDEQILAPLWQQAIDFVHKKLNEDNGKETVELIVLPDGSGTWSFGFDNIYCKDKEALVIKALELLKA